ncbi:hypothetical protein HZH68_000637 [Vespula germanica]|uniref:Uncharacterized protein n=1 Tax=Vespula germanica TaxID=30212 RepID=A0A834NUJ4_VESGE|nr:hypothetical protein HZH68_000637 [Vespula germanica]
MNGEYETKAFLPNDPWCHSRGVDGIGGDGGDGSGGGGSLWAIYGDGDDRQRDIRKPDSGGSSATLLEKSRVAEACYKSDCGAKKCFFTSTDDNDYDNDYDDDQRDFMILIKDPRGWSAATLKRRRRRDDGGNIREKEKEIQATFFKPKNAHKN